MQLTSLLTLRAVSTFLTLLIFQISPSTSKNLITPTSLSIDWKHITGVSKTEVSITVCPEPPMRRGSPIHDKLFSALRNLNANYARFQPWRPYPRLAVAELHPPKDGATSWDFSVIDPLVEDFMSASEGRPVIFTFGTIPSWMLNTEKPDAIPEDPDEITWMYGMNSKFNDFDSTVRLFADYQSRLAQWYLHGGFRDEYGKWHRSLHHYGNIVYWGVLNEPGAEHSLTPAQYTKIYDAVVTAVKKVAPNMKFIGPADDNVLANRTLPSYFPYFLSRRNHVRGTSIDALSYHFYANPDWDEAPVVLQHTTFKDADRLLTAASYIEVLRKYFSPNTKTAIEELGGSFLPWAESPEQLRKQPIDSSYWNLSGAMWAYAYGHLVGLGIDMLHGSELIDYPGQAASTTLVDWETGIPNSRYWVLKLLHEQLAPGDKLVARVPPDEAHTNPADYATLYPEAKVYSQGFVTLKGERKILLVNKRDEVALVIAPDARGGTISVVDQATKSGPISNVLASDTIQLSGLAVGIVTLIETPEATSQRQSTQ